MGSTIAFVSAEIRPAAFTAPFASYVGLAPHAVRLFERVISNRMRVKRRDSLYRPGDLFTAVYAIRVGTLKTSMLAEDGREQITGYFIGGEILGADGISHGHNRCGVVALEDSEVCVLPFHLLEKFAHELRAFGHNLYRLISKDVCRSQDMMFLLGSMRAEQRLVTYLLNLAARYQVRGYSGTELVLRMTREEIASMLGLKLETISRLFTHLQRDGFIQVQGRSVKLLDSARLKRIVCKQSRR